MFSRQQLNEQRCFSFQDYVSLCEFRICYIFKLGNLWKSHMFDEEETVSNFDSKMKKKLCPIPFIVNKSTSNLYPQSSSESFHRSAFQQIMHFYDTAHSTPSTNLWIPSLKLTQNLKMDGWKTIFLRGMAC